jgi:hypothetical protein
VGLLCARCAAKLTPSVPLLPRHIEGLGTGTDAWLIDCWGRPHALDQRSVLGREGDALRISTGHVSRAHAAIERDGQRWVARDLKSHNGTSVNDERLQASDARVLASGDIVRLADLGLLFITGALPAEAEEPDVVRTQTLAASAGDEHGPLGFSLHEHPMGGGGVIELADGRTLDLPLLQLELLQLLTSEWQRQPDVAAEVRGFVTSAYLMSVLSWDAHTPGPDHLKQLIRRTRAQLAGTGIGIEARRGAGYRLGRESSDA